MISIKQMHQKCTSCHYWYFKDIRFKYEPYVCNSCHSLMQKVISLNDVVIIYAKGSAYRIHFGICAKMMQ